jgi:hypothetical protein
MKRCYRVDYDGIHDSDYIWCANDKLAIEMAMQMASEGIDYVDIGHSALELVQIVEVDDKSEYFSEKRVIWY